MSKKSKMTRAEGLNAPEDPGIEEEIETENEEKDEEPEDTVGRALVAAAGASTSKDVSEMVKQTEEKFRILGEFIKRQLKEGTDYGQIAFHYKGNPTNSYRTACPNRFSPKIEKNCHVACGMSKAFLQKPGSEKFVILFGHRAKFFWITQNFETGLFAVKCVLIHQKTEKPMGEGYGSARVSEKKTWTENEAMKIACKRAQIDASLRTYGLSEHFTQDLDDVSDREKNPLPPPNALRSMPQKMTPPARPAVPGPIRPAWSIQPSNLNAPISQPQMNKIFLMVDRLGKNKEWFENWAMQLSGIEGIENLTMGWASKFIDAMNKKMQQSPAEELPAIDYGESPKRETDTTIPPPPGNIVMPEESEELI